MLLSPRRLFIARAIHQYLQLTPPRIVEKTPLFNTHHAFRPMQVEVVAQGLKLPERRRRPSSLYCCGWAQICDVEVYAREWSSGNWQSLQVGVAKCNIGLKTVRPYRKVVSVIERLKCASDDNGAE